MCVCCLPASVCDVMCLLALKYYVCTSSMYTSRLWSISEAFFRRLGASLGTDLFFLGGGMMMMMIDWCSRYGEQTCS